MSEHMSEPDITDRIADSLIFTRSHKMDGLTTALQDARKEIVVLRSAIDEAGQQLAAAAAASGRIRAKALEEARAECRIVADSAREVRNSVAERTAYECAGRIGGLLKDRGDE